MVKTTSQRKSAGDYHHGDLRNALLRVARHKLDVGEYDSLSLRELARLAGVSPNAPYRHFSAKDEILAELAAQGFDELSARFDADTEGEPSERLARMCDIYTGFAADNPAVYRVMFGADKPALMEFAVLDVAGKACFGRLVEATMAACGHGAEDDLETLRRALAIWSVVHGCSRLAIDGVLGFLPDGVLPLASEIVRPIIAQWPSTPADTASPSVLIRTPCR